MFLYNAETFMLKSNTWYHLKWICCAPSSDLPGLKTGLPHLPTKPWSEDGALVLRPGRSEDGAGGQKMGQGRKMGQVIQNIFSEIFQWNLIF